ncbi:MAG: hypothetical protein KGI37_10470 [Alphaproteobacteria bacterium]|nr:hypothetical protein [Alphaproteobacteria bacterium]
MIAALQVIDLMTTSEGECFAPAGRMASVIIDITQKCGDCLPQDLLVNGFAIGEIRAHWHMAKSLASVEMSLMASSITSERSALI